MAPRSKLVTARVSSAPTTAQSSKSKDEENGDVAKITIRADSFMDTDLFSASASGTNVLFQEFEDSELRRHSGEFHEKNVQVRFLTVVTTIDDSCRVKSIESLNIPGSTCFRLAWFAFFWAAQPAGWAVQHCGRGPTGTLPVVGHLPVVALQENSSRY